MKELEELIESDEHFVGCYSLMLSIKEQIKELAIAYAKGCLEKAAREAEVCTYYVDDEGEEIKLVGQRIYGDDYKYKVDFDCLPTFEVNKESITNIELP